MGEWLRNHGGEENFKNKYALAALLIIFGYGGGGSVNLSVGQYGRSMLLYLAVGSAGSILVFAAGAWLEQRWPALVRVMGLVGQETLLILCFHMFLFMFIRTAAGMLGLGEGLTQAALVVGSAGTLTAAGRLYRHVRRQLRKN